MVVYGGAICDGNSHSHANLPVILAGRGGGKIKPGRHLVYPAGTPMTNLYVALLDHMGIPMEKFGDSNGKLEHLTTGPWFVTPGMGVKPNDAPDKPETVTVRFDQGRPTAINGKPCSAFAAATLVEVKMYGTAAAPATTAD